MAGDFKEIFDINALTKQKLGQIEFVLNSPAFDDSFKPYMLGIIRELNRLWKDRSKERADKYPDDFLAGAVVFGEGLIEFFDRIIAETNLERIHGAMEGMSNDMLYTVKQRQGLVRPIVGLDQSAVPEKLDPAEDF